ncbi:MAG: DNA mismatch repair endonuclease MutL [Capsulimonadaceae bacterium]|nr:DNA mismatch repair endonuclease MutL [Capsulimonadaceae bacterium]
MDDLTSNIRILDDNTANQIAAGEVVERPASVVKELVENAIDSGAHAISVELEDAGKALIRVTDDGIGMSQADIVIALQRHATSKIRTAGDLFAIRTMGFRGEALPSIASVADVTIVSRPQSAPLDEPGASVHVAGGSVDEVAQVGVRSGTSITVENLFYNVPARLKFLKSNSTELSHITEMVQRFALAQPEIAFSLVNMGHEIFASRGSGSLLDACVQVYGRDQARNLVPMDLDRGELRVAGFVATPVALRPTRTGQHTFVNRRFVRDRAVMRAIDEGYSSVQTIHGGKHPPIVLMIDIDPALVDVNVSPTKTEVRFTRDRDVFSAVYHAIADALVQRGGLVPSIETRWTTGGQTTPEPAQPELMAFPSHPPATVQRTSSDTWSPGPSSYERPLRPSPGDPAAFRQEVQERAGIAPAIDDPFASEIPNAPDPPRESVPHRSELTSLRVLAQTRNMYIVAQTEKSLCIIDQHIAHERVLYEQLLKGHAAQSLALQHLIIPITLELGKREAMVINGRLDEIRKAGFDLEPFGGDSFLVRSVPAQIANKNPEKVVREIIDEIVEKSASRKLLVPAEEVLITASCKMAVKAGDPMTFDEMHALVAALLACDNPYTCPHGRPIIVEMSNDDLDRKFGR